MTYIIPQQFTVTTKAGVPWVTLTDGTSYAVPALKGYTVDFEFAGTTTAGANTGIMGASDNGNVCGIIYYKNEFQPYAVIAGKLILLDPPGTVTGQTSSISVNGSAPAATQPNLMAAANSVNNAGQVVGEYVDSSGNYHGYLYENGSYYQLDPGPNTAAVTIDNNGNISGEINSTNSATQTTFTLTQAEYNPLLHLLSAATPGHNFLVDDTGVTSEQAGTPYPGAVVGLISEYINVTTDNLAITAQTPNSFIHSGSGQDAIDVSKVGGNNVLDGGTGSNFLVGGKGDDTFFLDDRGALSPLWDTVVGFHSGDNATIWGITQAGFKLTWMNNEGAVGYKGLTGDFTAAGHPDAKITLAGYSTADLSNGKLSLTYSSIDGNNYLLIHGV
jgi:probable HAF family extracellular repeat protein